MFVSIYDGNPCEWALNIPTEGTPGPETALAEICRQNYISGVPNNSPIGPMKFGGNSSVYWVAAGWTMGRDVWVYFMIFSITALTEEECEGLLAEHAPEGLEGLDDEDEDEDEDEDTDDEY